MSPPFNTNSQSNPCDNDEETWEEVHLNDSILWGLSEDKNRLHGSALEISKHIQSMDNKAIDSLHGSLRKNSTGTDDTTISILINSLQESSREEKGHMGSIIDILEKNNEVLQSADQIIQIFELAEQIAKNNASICNNGDDDESDDESNDESDDDESTNSSSSSSFNDVMEKKPAQFMRITNRSSQPPPPPPPSLKLSPQLNRLHISNQPDQKKQTQTLSKFGSIQRDEVYRSQASDRTDSVLAMGLTNAQVIDEPSVIEGQDDKEYWEGMQGRSIEKTRKSSGRVYEQIGGDNVEDEFHTEKVDGSVPSPRVDKKFSANAVMYDEACGATRKRSKLDRRRKELNDLRKQRHEEMKKQASNKTSKVHQTDERNGIVDRLLKKKTQISMVSNTTASTDQSTPSLLGRQINVRSSMSVGSNRSGRRSGNASVASNSSRKSSRSQGSRASSRKSSFSRKSRLSRASSLLDDGSDNPSPIFVLPSPPIDEISVCASSLSCRSGRSPRQPSESGASSMSCRSGRSSLKQQLPQSMSEEKSSSWTDKMKAILIFKKKKSNT